VGMDSPHPGAVSLRPQRLVKIVTSVLFSAAIIGVFTISQAKGSVFGQSLNYGIWVGVALDWTAPGDDGSVGTATEYDFRCSDSYISEASWEAAVKLEHEPKPWPAGTPQEYFVSGLEAGRQYCFAFRAADEVPNWSTVSRNYVAVATPHTYVCGDVNCDGGVNLSDLTDLIDFLYVSFQPPQPYEAGNANGDSDGRINLGDITMIVNFLYLSGPAPICAES